MMPPHPYQSECTQVPLYHTPRVNAAERYSVELPEPLARAAQSAEVGAGLRPHGPHLSHLMPYVAFIAVVVRKVAALLIYAVTLPPVSHNSCWPFSQVRKGSLVHVTGRLRIDKYQDHYQNLQISVVIMAEEVSARAREH